MTSPAGASQSVESETLQSVQLDRTLATVFVDYCLVLIVCGPHCLLQVQSPNAEI